MNKLNLDDINIYRVMESMHEGILIADTTGRILFYNETQAMIDDIEPDDAIGKKIIDLYKLTNETSPSMRCIRSGQPITGETMVYQTRLGKVANIINHAYPLYKSDRLIGVINFSKDYQQLEKIVVKEKKPGKTAKFSNGAQFHFSDIIGSDPDIKNSIKVAKMASNSPSPIMIYGETGTGKELFAQSIHNHSKRKGKQFIPINCSAIPENLLEGILFGTSKGVFTGAIDKEGLFEVANEGTIFLDELDSMPLTLQTKLLRVIQEKKVRKLGSLKEINLDVKIISSVGKPPLEIVQKGILRMDLFYRMGVVLITLPPLRKKKNELKELTNHFIKKFNIDLNQNVVNISADVTRLFNNYHWPGNVRELEHIIEAAMNMVSSDRTIRCKHLPPHIFSFARRRIISSDVHNSQPVSSNLVERQEESENKYLCDALKKSGGNAAKAARSIGISPQLFQYKLKKYQIRRQDYIKK